MCKKKCVYVKVNYFKLFYLTSFVLCWTQCLLFYVDHDHMLLCHICILKLVLMWPVNQNEPIQTPQPWAILSSQLPHHPFALHALILLPDSSPAHLLFHRCLRFPLCQQQLFGALVPLKWLSSTSHSCGRINHNNCQTVYFVYETQLQLSSKSTV